MSKRVIVRADDLGWTEAINYGIAKSVREGIIRSVGVMPNMPAARHGLDLLAGVPVCFGQHTNICVGRPVTDSKLIPSLCQPDGTFKPSSAYREAYKRGEEFVVLDEVVLEIEAQYQRFVELVGDKPHYFEAHAVASDNFFKGLEIVAKRHGLLYLPLVLDAPVKFRNSKLTVVMDSLYPNYDPFASLKRIALKDYDVDSCPVLIFHPGYLDDELLRNSSLTIPRTKEVAMSIDPATKAWLKENDVQVITYDDLA